MYMETKAFDYTIILQKEPEGGYTVTVPALPGCVTYGETVEDAKEKASEAIGLYLETLNAHKEEVPVESDVLHTQIHIRPAF